MGKIHPGKLFSLPVPGSKNDTRLSLLACNRKLFFLVVEVKMSGPVAAFAATLAPLAAMK